MSTRLVDDRGRALDAEYHVEADGSQLALILESRSGMSGARPPRNPDYNRAQTVLLTTLAALNAVLTDALVDSRYTQQMGVPEADRRLIEPPIELARVADMDALRRRMGAAQARIAQAPGATKGGNTTKRIRLRVDVPGYRPGRAARLAQVLAVPITPASAERPTYWWELDPGENVFMEITRRDDMGANLQAPVVARGGVTTASYSLVPLARPGHVVVHYDSRQEAIVGVSVAVGSAESSPVYWVSRGGYARRAGERPRWLPGTRVALDHYQELDAPVSLADIRAQKDALMALRRQIQDRAGGQPIYFPWIPYRDTLRTFQSYLVKLPQEAIDLFAQLRRAVDQAEARSSVRAVASPVVPAEEAIEDAAGKVARRGRGQGFQLDQEAKVAVEAHAMNMAAAFYATDWDVEDVHGRESYDLICRRGNEVKHVEVKGTTTDGAEVILTPNEVDHAREMTDVALFILANVVIERADDGTVTATDGICRRHDPWHIDDGALIPLGFKYRVPGLSDPPGRAPSA